MKRSLLLSVALFFLVSVASAQPGVKVYSELVRWHEVSGGKTKTAKIEVGNTTSEEIRVRIGTENYFFGIEREGTEHDHNRSLDINYSPSVLQVPAKSLREITYSVTLPDSASGSYWKMLTVMPVSQDALSDTSGTVQMKQRYRWGINVVATAPGGKVDVKVNRVRHENGNLLLDLKNTGSVSIRPMIELQVFNQNGERVGTFKGTQHLLHPKTSLTTNIDVSSLESREYSGVLILDGRKNKYGLRIDFEINE